MPTDNNNKNNNTLHHQTSSSSYIPPGAAAVHQGTPKASAASASASPTTYLAPMSGRRILSETFSIGSALSTIDGLHGVYMSKCSLFGIEEDTRISQKLKYFDQTRAREFDFSNIRVGPSFRCVLDALIAAPEIECLVWRRGGLDDGHVEAIVNAARRFIGLQEIDLGENEDISDVGGALLLQLVGGRNNNNGDGNGNGNNNRNTPMLQKRPPQLVRLDQTNVSFDMQAKINKAISTPILSRPGVIGQTSPTSPTSRRKSFNHVNTSSNKNKNSNNNNNMTVQQQQQRKNANRSVNQTLKYLMLMSGNENNNTNDNDNIKTTTGNDSNQLFDDRIHSASIVLSCIMYFHNFLCSILAIALWIPGYRFKTVIYCFCYFVGVALTFGPSSGVIDALAIGMILIGVQRWRHYYAASSQFQQQQMFYSSFLPPSSSSSSKNNNNQLVVPFSPEAGFSGSNNNSSSNFTAQQRFQGLSQAARRRWSHFLDPLEELTNILQVANQKRKMVMTSSSKNHNTSNILRNNNNTEDNDDEYQEQQLIFFEQMVRNCTFQYTRFLINTFIILPSPSSTFSSSFTSGSESSGSISSHHLHETRFVLLLTGVVSSLLAMIVRLVTGQSAYAVATIFVIFGALYFGSEPFLASSFYANLFSGVPVSIKPASAVGGRSGLISISSIIKYYRIRIGRWIAGNPVTSAEEAEEAMTMSAVTQQNPMTTSSSTSLTTTTNALRRKPPFSFVVEILRIEDAIIKTKSSLNSHDNNTLSIAPLAKIRCMHKSWTSSSADTHYSFSKSTQSCITTSALWHPESSTVFHSPHPYDTAKMEFSIYDCNNNTSNNDDHTNDGNESTSNHHQHHHHHHETSTTTTTNTAVDVLLSGIFLVDDDLVFGEEIAIPLMKNDKINNTTTGSSHQISSSSSTNNNKGSSSSGVFGGLFGSSAASDGLWSLSHKLLEQIDQRDADERIRHHVPHNSYTNGNHHHHHHSSRSRR